MAVDIVATFVGAIVVVVVVVTIVLVVRGPRVRHEGSRVGSRGGRRRVVARSMRGWQAQTLRDIRRNGRSHGTRGR